jgi:MFS family permease
LFTLYAALQFLTYPILGTSSDCYGCRPVLLASLAGDMIDYVFMAWAPGFWWLFLGRAVVGLRRPAPLSRPCVSPTSPRRSASGALCIAWFGELADPGLLARSPRRVSEDHLMKLVAKARRRSTLRKWAASFKEGSTGSFEVLQSPSDGNLGF